MPKTRLVYILSLRNAAADRAGQFIDHRDGPRYMTSPLEYLCQALDTTPLGDVYSLEGVLFDDDADSAVDRRKLDGYGFAPATGQPWFWPVDLTVQGRRVADLLQAVPSTYRRLPMDSLDRAEAKSAFERRLGAACTALAADVVLLDGLLVILDRLVRPGSRFHQRILNIHPGITRDGSPHQRRGAYATLDALHGARGERVDWATRQTTPVPVVDRTGASLHVVDTGIDSGPVVHDVLATPIGPDDTILELRWNNFQRSLFPALHEGLLHWHAIRPAGTT